MESHKLVYIRTDGNETIATGHLMRCLTIARALEKREAHPVFMVSDTTSISVLRGMMTPQERNRNAFPVIHLQTDYREPEKELPAVQNILSSHAASYLLVDSYFVTPDYLSSLRGFCRVAYIDDRQAFDYPVDLVINYDIIVNTGFYKKAYQIFSGGAYTPLRDQFSLCPYRLWEEVRDVFISTGGTDPYNIACRLTRQLLASREWEGVCFHVLTGPMHVHRAELDALAEKNERVILHENVTNMAELMSECDLAVSAAGTTLYELCAIGVPAVSYTMADNQIPGAKAFGQAGLIPCVGDVRSNPDFFRITCEKMLELAKDPSARRQQSMRMRMAIDGAGADRIAAALLTPPRA